jgi:hypothetical protein
MIGICAALLAGCQEPSTESAIAQEEKCDAPAGVVEDACISTADATFAASESAAISTRDAAFVAAEFHE